MKPINAFLKAAGKWTKDNGPHILVAVGISGMLATVITAVKATPKAKKLIEQAEEDKGEKLTPVETVKATWKCYAIPAATFVVSSGCIIFASAESAKRNAALATACSISETALATYQEKVVETIGEEKERAVREEVAKAQLEAAPPVPSEIFIAGSGEQLCYDALSGRYFKCTLDRINQVINELNQRMLFDDYISLNDFYYEVGLEGIEIGEILGWNVKWDLIRIVPDGKLTKDGVPCIVVDFKTRPNYDFDKIY